METDPDEADRWERFGRALEGAMAKSRLRTQTQLAAYLGVDQTLVSAWKRGLKLGRMSPTRVAKIERGLGAAPGTLSAILFGAAPAPPDPSQLEQRLDTIEAALADQAATMAEILRVIREADRPRRDQDT
jgi:transcriptional regulator with XRE-family HTH domain